MQKNIKPKKSLGQHFLNSPSVLAKIIDTAKLQKGETVLEIGPGTGVLTQPLLQAGVKVIAIEKDQLAYNFLEEKFRSEINAGSLVLHCEDILKINRPTYGLEENNYAVIANIPYYITGAILESFLEYDPRPNRMVLLVQKEVAERIVARDGKESLLSISVKAFGEPKLIAKVPRGAFIPAPNVDSAILAINNISDHKFTEKRLDIKLFFNILKAGFAHKRKYLKRNLESVIHPDELTKTWTRIGLSDKIRAEDVTLGEWVEITSTQLNGQ